MGAGLFFFRDVGLGLSILDELWQPHKRSQLAQFSICFIFSTCLTCSLNCSRWMESPGVLQRLHNYLNGDDLDLPLDGDVHLHGSHK